MNAGERRAFVRAHRTAVFGYNRDHDGPAMSVVYYVMPDDHTILVSTVGDSAKAKAVARLGHVSLCILDEQWPVTYLQVSCTATVDPDPVAAGTLAMEIASVMAGRPLDDAVRPLVIEGARTQGRVVLRLTPYATFETPPPHVFEETDLPLLAHPTNAALPWDEPEIPEKSIR